MIGGGIFGKTFQFTGRFAMTVGIFVFAAGLGVVNFAGSIFMLSVGTTLVGIGFFTIFPAAMMGLGKIVPPAGFALATGIMMAAMNLGGFISPYYMALLANVTGNTDIRFPIFVGMSFALITAVLVGISKLKPEPQPDTP
jgi:MFS family permease